VPSPAYARHFAKRAAPDAVVLGKRGEPIIVIECCFGWRPVDVMAAVDRLLKLILRRTTERDTRLQEMQMAACVFIYEVKSGDIIQDVEREMCDWLAASYGPFNGIARTGLPMSVRLTRTAKHAALTGGIRLPVVEWFIPIGYVAFCISYETCGF
jgi:hypothetical protein